MGPGETAKVTIIPLDDGNETTSKLKNVLLKANAAGKYQGWVNKDLKQASESPTAYAIVKIVDNDELDETKQNWSKSNQIMNQPYFLENTERIDINADKSLFADSDYYPSADDKVFKGKTH